MKRNKNVGLCLVNNLNIVIWGRGEEKGGKHREQNGIGRLGSSDTDVSMLSFELHLPVYLVQKLYDLHSKNKIK